MISHFLYFILIVTTLKQVCKSDENDISFLRQDFNLTVWNTLRQHIRCQTEHGNWTKEITATTNTFKKNPSSQSPCDRDHKLNPYAQQGRCPTIFKGPSMNYSWEVSEKLCAHPLVKFNASHFCEMMHQRVQGNIFFVGDSIQHEFAAEFTSALHIELGNQHPKVSCRTCYHLCEAQIMYPQYCPKDRNSYVNYFNLSIDRNDYLHIHTNKNGSSSKSWESTLKSHNIGLLLMNRGAHFRPTAEVISDLNTTLSKVFELSPTISVVWRNTPPGHHDFEEKFFSPPSTSMPDLSGYYALKYKWNQFFAQNRAVESFLTEVFPQVLQLDFYTPTALRADSHIDYLHYCIPGPLSLWPILLYNALKIIDDYAMIQ